MESTETCPRCKTTKYRNPKMKLMINICGHPLCETCVEQLFFRGSATCPTCNKSLKKADYREQVFEDSYVEKEIAIRKKILKDFSFVENDFPSLKEFNDYLEKIETFIFNLANNLEEEKTNQTIDELKKELKQKKPQKQKLKTESLAKENPIYVYKPLTIDLLGPALPSNEVLIEKYVQNVTPIIMSSHRPGGFVPILPVKRALQEAFSGLFVSVKY